jgi:hypothetical protein
MRHCVYCNKKLPKRQRKYCDKTCSMRFKSEGPAREQYVYNLVEKEDNDAHTKEIDALVSKGAWLLFPRAHEDEQCIGDFMRIFKRAPEHVLWSPSTPFWKYAGPVFTDEELAYRWRGWK